MEEHHEEDEEDEEVHVRSRALSASSQSQESVRSQYSSGTTTPKSTIKTPREATNLHIDLASSNGFLRLNYF